MANLESNLEGIFRVSGSTSMASSYTNRSGNRVSKLFRSRSAAGLSVCRWCFCWVSLLSASSHLTFFAASQTVPTGTRPPTPSLKTAEGSGGGGDRKGEAGGIHSNRRILIVLSISALFLACLFFMGFLKFLRFKIRSKSKRAVNDGGLPTTTTTHVPYPQDLSFGDISKMTTSSVKKFSWDEIESLTMNFSRVVGEGGFSTVYLAYFSDSTLGALKIHNSSERLNQVFKQELETLLHIRHDNIVKLLGYCDEREVGVLVFEYVPNGSLHEKLHNRGGGRDSVLSWKARMSIAYQLAQAIEYLHDKCTLQIVHCDIKTSNVLLDEQLNCKLCDFGFAKMGFSSTVVRSSMNPVMGSPGYMDPHYLRTGLASKKNDVYGFGVIILELITGIEAFSEKEQLLTSIADPVLRDPNKVAEMVDPQLAGHFDKEEAIAMASIAALCLRKQPILRPSIAEILRTMKEKISSVSFSTGAED